MAMDGPGAVVHVATLPGRRAFSATAAMGMGRKRQRDHRQRDQEQTHDFLPKYYVLQHFLYEHN
jgi:hypothetical protein